MDGPLSAMAVSDAGPSSSQTRSKWSSKTAYSWRLVLSTNGTTPPV